MSIFRSTGVHPTRAKVLCGLFVGLVATTSTAQAADGLLLRIGAAGGGDEIFTGQLTNGETVSIDAGEGVFLEFGARMNLLGPGLDTDLTVGYQSASVDASNGSATFSRVTVNLMQSFALSESIRIGGGVTYHVNTELEVDVPGVQQTTEGEAALGYMLGADYLFSGGRFELGIRATQIEYESDNAAAVVVEGDNVGGHLTYRF